jgi:hypothetical protein
MQPAARAPGLRAPAGARQHMWRGASGRDYAHVVYPLLECPPLPVAGYVLVRRDGSGRLEPLHVGVGLSAAPTLNLAEVRQRAAQAGANEVHVHTGIASEAERRLIACDLRASLLGTRAAAAVAEGGAR